MRHRFIRAMSAMAIVGGTAGGLLASGTFASASPKVPASTLGTWTLHYNFFNTGAALFTTGLGSITFGPHHVYTTTGYTGTYTYSAVNGKVSFKINTGCYPVYTLYGSSATGFGGTIHCTSASFPHENGYTALGNPPGLAPAAHRSGDAAGGKR